MEANQSGSSQGRGTGSVGQDAMSMWTGAGTSSDSPRERAIRVLCRTINLRRESGWVLGLPTS
jgi:hypothetical protein